MRNDQGAHGDDKARCCSQADLGINLLLEPNGVIVHKWGDHDPFRVCQTE